MSDYVRFEVKHVSLSLPKKRPNISISPSLCSCEPDFSFSPKVNISFLFVMWVQWMLEIQLKECSSWKWSRMGGWAAGEVMGHSQDAPHGAYYYSAGERAPCGACTLTRHAQDGNDEAYWTCPTFTASPLPFRIEIQMQGAWKCQTFPVKWKV